MTELRWEFIDPNDADPKDFKMDKVWALKIVKYPQGFFPFDKVPEIIGGWKVIRKYLEEHPATGKKLKRKTPFLFSARGPQTERRYKGW